MTKTFKTHIGMQGTKGILMSKSPQSTRRRGFENGSPGGAAGRTWVALLLGLALLLVGATAVRADQNPPGCAGSGLGISLYASVPNAHVGDTVKYSVLVFNTPFPACNAGETNSALAGAIQAYVVTPDGVTNQLTLKRTFLAPGESDLYTDVVSYVVRAQDILPDGTVRAIATDVGDIHQNDTNSRGGGFQGVNTEVKLACIRITATCSGGVGETGTITFSGTVTNCGNTVLSAITVTNACNGQLISVDFPATLAVGASAPFSGSWVPADPCNPSTGTLTVQGTDLATAIPRTVTSSAAVTCQNTLTPGIKVTRGCAAAPVGPGQVLSYSGSVSNTGNVTLTNVVVRNDINGATPIFTVPTLAPGQVVGFDSSYTVPAGSACSITTVLSATAHNHCSGALITDAISTTCPLITTPAIAVSLACPPNAATAGGPITYSGTVTNLGDVILTNIVVVNNHPAEGTVVANIASLAPGAVGTFAATFATPANTCAISTTVTAWGSDVCSLVSVTNQASATCPLVSNPHLLVTQICPAAPVAPGGTLTFGGVVSNDGDVTLTHIVVMGDRTGLAPVFEIASLAPGASAPFTGSYVAPLNACSVTATLNAVGQSACSGQVVSNSVTTTCSLTVTPDLAVTLVCPETAVDAGSPITYQGVVRNAGNITLQNITVVNNHPATGTVVLTVPSLEPGAAAPFTATFNSPSNVCSVSSTVTAWGGNACNAISVTNSASATCPLGTAPKLVVTHGCPAVPAGLGETLVYSGTVSNAGTIALTNIVVINDQTGLTPVFTVALLHPGESTNFTGSFVVPLTNDCSVTSTLLARADEACGGAMVTSTSTSSCLLHGIAKLAVDQTCPAEPAVPGGILTYSGSVSNAGNITLTNVVVVNNRPVSNTVVTTVAYLAPGAVAPFTGSYTVPLDCCVVWSTVTATGQAPCSGVTATDTRTTTCPVRTSPAIIVTRECPPAPVGYGDTMKLSGIVSNSGNITLLNVNVAVTPKTGPNQTALGNGVTVTPIKLDLHQTNQSPVLTWPITLAPGESVRYLASYKLTPDECGIDTVTATGSDVCTGVAVASSVTGSCSVTSAPAIAVYRACPAQPIPKGSLYTYTGTVTNTGNSTLVEIMVYDNMPSNQTPVLGPITLAPGASANFTGSYVAPKCCCYLVDTLTVVGRDRCSLDYVYNSSSSLCPLQTTATMAVVLGCPPSPFTAGTIRNYTGYITNSGDVNLTNVIVAANFPAGKTVLGPLELAPREVKTFSGSFVIPENFNDHPLLISATAKDICQARAVTAQASCSGDSTNVYLYPLAGTYNGLFFNPDGVKSDESGFFTLTMRSQGSYSGSVKMAGKSYSVSGKTTADGRATNSIKQSSSSTLTVLWNFARRSGMGTVAGSVGNGTWSSLLEGDLAGFNSKTNPCPLAGKQYTLIFTGSAGSSNAPQGDGFGKATIDANGVVNFTGTLADGTAVAQKVAISANGDWPLWDPLYSNKGGVIGWMQFVDKPASDISGKLSWIKPASSSKLYPAGFAVTTDGIGSVYTAPTGSGTILPNPAQIFYAHGGELPAPLQTPVTLGANGKVTTTTAGLSMSFKTSDGSYSGSYKPPGNSTTYKFKGAALQKVNTASGYILTPTQSGKTWFAPAVGE